MASKYSLTERIITTLLYIIHFCTCYRLFCHRYSTTLSYNKKKRKEKEKEKENL